jgi:threonine/homoserine efflux transporter RhtA
VGAAISVELFDEIGVGRTAWLRVSIGALGPRAVTDEVSGSR